ncbi:MAG TPA: aldehyde dehydrogenase family protein [Acidimicrobiales bacterium]
MADRRAHATALARGVAERGLIIGSDRPTTASGGTHTHRDPATGAPVADVALAGTVEVDAAVAAARDALPAWRALAPHRRARLLNQLADRLDAEREDAATLTAVDNGTPVSTLDPGRAAAQWTRYYAGWVDKLEGRVLPAPGGSGLDFVLPEPYGVIAAMVPWNGPMMGMGQKAAPALAAGNTVVAKPPEIAPFGAVRFAELALDAGLPPGVVNVVVGGAEAGAALTRHRGVDKISFTGGAAAAREVMVGAAEALTPLALELGGKSANIVFADADLDAASTISGLLGAVLLSGQGCALPTRLFVHESVADELVDRVVALVGSAAVGDPLDPATLMGPLATEASRDRVLAVIEEAIGAGATLRTGGRALGADDLGHALAGGWFLAPTVLTDVDDDSDVARHEVFGPVLSVLTFTDEDEVVARANALPYGLAAYVHTRDLARAHRLAGDLEVGSVTVNGFPTNSPTVPFGGVKQSGFGREGGKEGLDEFLRPKNVLISE